MIDSIGSKFKDYTPLVVRLGLAVIAILIGARILSAYIGKSDVMRLLEGGVFILCGFLVFIGFLTRWAGFALGIVFLVHILNGPRLHAITQESHQVWFAALMMSIAVFFCGGGEWSVDLKQKRKKDK